MRTLRELGLLNSKQHTKKNNPKFSFYLYPMNINPLKRIFSKVGSQSSSLKSYIKEIEKSRFHQWSFRLLKINIEAAINKSGKTYSYTTEARHYGDWVILNEEYYFDIPEQSLAKITKQVFDISDWVNSEYIILKYDTEKEFETSEFFQWCFKNKKWKKINKDQYWEIIYKF